MTVTEPAQISTLASRPRYEGANVRTWIGFKHFMYLVEEALLQWFRDRGVGPQRLYHEFGLGLEVMDSSVLLPAVLEVDDEVSAEVGHLGAGRFSVRLSVERDGRAVNVLRGKATVAVVRERTAAPSAAGAPALDVPVVDEARAPAAETPAELPLAPDAGVRDLLTPPGSPAFLWSWRVPYFACHYSDRVQHSAYIRALESVVDRFLADRGISVGRMLRERGWIPVVSRARVQILADAHMEETMHTTFVVEGVLKRLTYDGRMDCYVQRGDRLVPVASARIMHGYALSRGERAGSLAELDDDTIAVLTGGPVR